MSYRKALVFSLLALAQWVALALPDQEPTASNMARFEALKKLAGDWVEVGADGKPTSKVMTSIRVTSGGTAVHETVLPGTPEEMITMYHLDGADLILTHYCHLGNQPRMTAEPGKDAKRIEFKFSSCGNLKSPDDLHMHDATLILVDDDHYSAEWTACKDGKACHQVSLKLVRKK